MNKPTIILATSNGVGMGHLARACAVALELKEIANPIIVSVAGGVAEIPEAMGIPCEYIPGKNRDWMPRSRWDAYLNARLVALAQETNAKVISFDGVVPYPGFIATKSKDKNLQLVWVRRGLWQKNLLRFVLPIQSRLMSKIIEPGDFARSYDKGPTSKLQDSVLSAPVSLFSPNRSIDKVRAREILGLDRLKPAVLVQLGTGDSDMNAKLTAALSGLIGWKDLQIVLTKRPVDQNGKSLIPDGLEITVIRYFPLADVLKAFDAAISATGYNSVHELLPAEIPTVLISNIRGTDDQEVRAIWCDDHGYAIRADHSDLVDITKKVLQLQSAEIRSKLARKCSELPDANGAQEIAKILYSLATAPDLKTSTGDQRILRSFVLRGLHLGTYLYRSVRPHKLDARTDQSETIFSTETNAQKLRAFISSGERFEQLFKGSSVQYLHTRKKIAVKFYGEKK